MGDLGPAPERGDRAGHGGRAASAHPAAGTLAGTGHSGPVARVAARGAASAGDADPDAPRTPAGRSFGPVPGGSFARLERSRFRFPRRERPGDVLRRLRPLAGPALRTGVRPLAVPVPGPRRW